MSKLKNAIFGFSASGSISGGLTYLRRMHQQIVEKTPVIKDAKTTAQLSWRHMFLKVVALWHALSAAEKEEWESAARPKHMTGYAWFVSQALRPNPGIYLPLQGGKMQGEIDMDGFRIEDLPDPIANQDPDTQAARIAAILAHIAVAAAHHAKYTNAQAIAAAKTIKLDDFATPDDNTDLNASAARHGLFKKLDGVATHFLNGLGNWAAVVSGPTIVSGSYTGTGITGARQIATGIKCSLVVIWNFNLHTASHSTMLIPTNPFGFDGANRLSGCELHATDGFTVAKMADYGNVNGHTYYYWAISE